MQLLVFLACFFSKVNLRKTLGGIGSPLVKEGLRSMVLGYLSDSQIVQLSPQVNLFNRNSVEIFHSSRESRQKWHKEQRSISGASKLIKQTF